MTAEEFLSLGETSQRLELVDGVVVGSPRPLPIHQRLARLITRAIEDTLPAGGQIFNETDVFFGLGLVYCPDVVIYAPGRLPRVPDRLALTPDLIVEILSPENRRKDLVSKREDYLKFGVGEYWIVDPAGPSVLALRQHHQAWTERRVSSGTLASDTIPEVRVDLSTLKQS